MHNLLRIQAPNGGIDALRELGLVHECGWNVHEPIISRSAAANGLGCTVRAAFQRVNRHYLTHMVISSRFLASAESRGPEHYCSMNSPSRPRTESGAIQT